MNTAETKSKTEDATSPGEKEKMWLALLLAWIAGFADAFGFLALEQIFFSAVSGNTVAVNAYLAKGNLAKAAQHGCPIIFFALGLVIGLIMEKIMRRIQVRRRLGVILGIEAALLLLLVILGPSFAFSSDGLPHGPFRLYFIIALLSGAMGIQTASLRRVRHRSVSTPFVTGMLVQSVENAVNVLFNAVDRRRNREPEFPDDSLWNALFHGSLWLCFAVGALCGGFGELSWGFRALLAPVAALAFVIVCDLVRPLYD
jgi:uncharacterized membrane protein YoaK (UPF0700 family)